MSSFIERSAVDDRRALSYSSWHWCWCGRTAASIARCREDTASLVYSNWAAAAAARRWVRLLRGSQYHPTSIFDRLEVY